MYSEGDRHFLSLLRSAAAVETAVRSAGPTGLLQLLSQGTARSVEAHHGVVGSDPDLGREIHRPHFAEIYPAEDLCVLRLQSLEQRLKAEAELGDDLRRRLDCLFDLGREALQGPQFCCMSPPVICESIPQYPVEPGNHPLLIPDLCCMLEPLDESLLKDVLGGGSVVDPSLDKGEESPMILDQRLQHSTVLLRHTTFFNSRLHLGLPFAL